MIFKSDYRFDPLCGSPTVVMDAHTVSNPLNINCEPCLIPQRNDDPCGCNKCFCVTFPAGMYLESVPTRPTDETTLYVDDDCIPVNLGTDAGLQVSLFIGPGPYWYSPEPKHPIDFTVQMRFVSGPALIFGGGRYGTDGFKCDQTEIIAKLIDIPPISHTGFDANIINLPTELLLFNFQGCTPGHALTCEPA